MSMLRSINSRLQSKDAQGYKKKRKKKAFNGESRTRNHRRVEKTRHLLRHDGKR